MKEDNKNKINRRDFFKLAGAGTLASAAALYGCSGNKNNGESESAALGEIPTGKMTYRTNPNTGDRVSLLGYGCMRWPTRKRADGNGDEIDQEAVNDLIDYAIAHGVNYFDTSPAYVQGLSERATGIALKRHPREKFFLATKLSNFSPSTHSREESLAMYHRSFRDLQVDYIDYLLLHGIGMGGIGSDAAIEAADILLMDDDPLKISKAIQISRKCIRIVYENIYFAIGIKVICLVLGALGIANMWFAIFADVGVMILAVLNAIRTLFVKKL